MTRIARSITRTVAACIGTALIAAAGLVFGGGGATGTGYVADGAISDFGSIFVNGVEFFIDKASITVNGVSNRSQSDLRIGMVLRVYGSIDGSGTTGNATTVEYHSDALGMVDRAASSGDPTASFGVLGQNVATDARTVFAGALGVDDLRLGDYVEVSGFPSPTGLLATRVERKSSMPTVQVKGILANLSGNSFTVGTLGVDDGIATFKNVPSTGLANGQTVVVTGPPPSNGVLVASNVEVINTSVGASSNGSASGVVSDDSNGTITVNGLAMSVTSSTQYVNGGASDVAVGTLVKVDFAVSGSTVVATRIEFTKLDAPSYVEANVTGKGAGFVELLGPGGVIVTANSATQLQDNSDAKLKVLTLADINVGDHLQVDGNQVNEDTVLATKIVRRRPSTPIAIEGRALSAFAPVFTVIDLPITVTASTDLRDENGVPIPADTFFAKAAGHNVSVVATLQGGALVATSVRLDY